MKQMSEPGVESDLPANVKAFKKGFSKWTRDLRAAYRKVSSDDFEAVVDGFDAWRREIFPGAVPDAVAEELTFFEESADNFRMLLDGKIIR
jgi:hypothetical protein